MSNRALPMIGIDDGDVVVRSWGEQAVSIMGQTSRCCMVCLMPQSQVSGTFEYLKVHVCYVPMCDLLILSVCRQVCQLLKRNANQQAVDEDGRVSFRHCSTSIFNCFFYNGVLPYAHIWDWTK